MPQLIINNTKIDIHEGSTVLDACQQSGIEIPTLCYLHDYRFSPSCMVCMVQEKKSHTLIPSCSVPASEGMIIETDNEEVYKFRKAALELLLSEHVGWCEGPCELSCPLHINIPLMIRTIIAGDYGQAIRTIKKEFPFPATFERLCPAPCEKACRRGHYDSPISIRLLIRSVVDKDLASDTPYIPHCKEKTGKRVAIVGSGPAGLFAAYHLLRKGHACIIFDTKHEPGGMLRELVAQKKLPCHILDKELNLLRILGGEFRMARMHLIDLLDDELHKDFDAVCLCTDTIISMYNRGNKDHSYIFTADVREGDGDNSRLNIERRLLKKSAAGTSVAKRIDRFLRDREGAGSQQERIFSSKTWSAKAKKMDALSHDADASSQTQPKGGLDTGFAPMEAEREARRCLLCDCAARNSCRLRYYAQNYGARQFHYRGDGGRKCYTPDRYALVTYDPGKCIQCGICVRITEKAGERYGFTFIGKGLDMTVGTPFHHPIDDTDIKVIDECVTMCPTGALTFRNEHVI